MRARAMDRNTPILLVDDYRTMLRIIRNLLQQLGFTDVDEALDGASALRMLRRKAYGLVISDWNIQPMSGLELLRAVRAEPQLESLPFIMITAANRAESVAAATEAGVTDCIVKPFNAETLRATIAGSTGA